MDHDQERHWKVGDLASATGLTVRALHHYDDIGLLVPQTRTSAGHRLYAYQDVRRLYHVLALRGLGLSLERIGSLLDDAGVSLVDTVRRHLEQVERDLAQQQRLHQRLREILDALERSVEPAVAEFIEAMEAMTVTAVEVKDVVMWVSAEETEEPPPPLAREGSRVVLLGEDEGERILPIWVGAQEGDLLAARLGEWSQGRPMGPDLTARLLEASGARVERVVIESARERTYYASVTVTWGHETHEVDARPSDALNLAVRVGAPVFIASDLLDGAGVEPRAFANRADEKDGASGRDEWRPLTPKLLRSMDPREARAQWARFSSQAVTAESTPPERPTTMRCSLME